MREEARQRVLLHRLHFAAQAGQRLAPDLAQDFGVAPLAMEAARPESPFQHAPFDRQLPQHVLHRLRIERKPRRGIPHRERAMRPRISAHEFEHRVRHRLQQRSRQPRRQRNPQRIAVAGGVFGGNQAALAGNAQLQQAPRANQPVHLLQQVGRGHTQRQALRATGRRAANTDRECRPPNAPGNSPRGTARPVPLRRSRRHRAARAGRPRPEFRATDPGRRSAPGPAARPAAHRRRKQNWPRS